MMTDQCVLKIEGVCKSFPGVKALDRVTFSVNRGECHCLVGQNGAGKSTLIKILSGAYPMDSGSIFLNGIQVRFHSPNQALQSGISVLYQELALNPYFNAVENIFMGQEIRKRMVFIDYKSMRAEARSLIERFGVPVDIDKPVGQLSVAHQQIVALAKAFSLDAKVVILDEPSAVLTSDELERLFTIIERLKENGVTVIYISHRLEEIFQIGDRVTVLRDGCVVGTHHVSDIDQADLVKMMVGRELGLEFPCHTVSDQEYHLELHDVLGQGLMSPVSFGIKKGEIVGIFGLVGAGRTELAHIIAGVTRKQSGRVVLNGKELDIRSPADAISEGIALLPENRKDEGLVLTMSVEDNCTLPIWRQHHKGGFVDSKKLDNIAKNYVRKLDIKTPGLDYLVENLSGGNQQKVVLSKWLAAHCNMLILDEPTRGVDVGAKVDMYKLIADAANEGRSVLLISSELPEVMGLTDRILVMRAGSVVGEFDSATVAQETLLARAMGVA